MNITKATASIEGLGYPLLRLTIDGHPAYVSEPKQTLLDQGIVVLLDEAGYWENTVSAIFRPDSVAQKRNELMVLRGAVADPKLAGIVMRFLNGETGNLLL